MLKQKKNGFTLLEMTISMSILSIIAMLAFVVLRSSTEAATISMSKSQVQANLRDVMMQITSEVRGAYTQGIIDNMLAPANTEAITVENDGGSITFQIPEPTGGPDMVAASSPVTLQYITEDENGNARLDDGEDTDGDGVLTRRLVRIQDGVQTILAAANSISSAQFQLLPSQDSRNNNLTSLLIQLESTIRYGGGEGKLVKAAIESRIDLKN